MLSMGITFEGVSHAYEMHSGQFCFRTGAFMPFLA